VARAAKAVAIAHPPTRSLHQGDGLVVGAGRLREQQRRLVGREGQLSRVDLGGEAVDHQAVGRERQLLAGGEHEMELVGGVADETGEKLDRLAVCRQDVDVVDDEDDVVVGLLGEVLAQGGGEGVRAGRVGIRRRQSGAIDRHRQLSAGLGDSRLEGADDVVDQPVDRLAGRRREPRRVVGARPLREECGLTRAGSTDHCRQAMRQRLVEPGQQAWALDRRQRRDAASRGTDHHGASIAACWSVARRELELLRDPGDRAQAGRINLGTLSEPGRRIGPWLSLRPPATP
jgi:hypothetical protein